MAKAKRKPARYTQAADPAVAHLAERMRTLPSERVPVLERALFGALAEQLSNPLLPMLADMEQGLRLFAAFEVALAAAGAEGVEVEDACADDDEVARYRERLVGALHAFGARRDGPERLITRLAGVGARQMEHKTENSAELVIRVWAWFLLGVAAGPERNAEPDDWMMKAILTAARGWANQMVARIEATQADADGESEEPGGDGDATVSNADGESDDATGGGTRGRSADEGGEAEASGESEADTGGPPPDRV